MYAQYDGLIFDMDGTILDTEPTHRKAWTEVLGRYGMRFDLGSRQRWWPSTDHPPGAYCARYIIELNQADLDPHLLAREKTDAVKAMLLDTVRPLPLIDVVKEWHGRRPMSVGTGSENSHIAEALLDHLGLLNLPTHACPFLRWLPPIMLKITSPHRTPSCSAQN